MNQPPVTPQMNITKPTKPRELRIVGFEHCLVEVRCPDCKSLLCKSSKGAIVEITCRKCHNNLYLFSIPTT